jgi:hypothetical protein
MIKLLGSNCYKGVKIEADFLVVEFVDKLDIIEHRIRIERKISCVVDISCEKICFGTAFVDVG